MKFAHLPAASASPKSGQGNKLDPRDLAKQHELRQECGASGPAASRQKASRAKGAKSDWPELSSVTASDKASNERLVPARRGSRPGPSGPEAPVCVAGRRRCPRQHPAPTSAGSGHGPDCPLAAPPAGPPQQPGARGEAVALGVAPAGAPGARRSWAKRSGRRLLGAGRPGDGPPGGRPLPPCAPTARRVPGQGQAAGTGPASPANTTPSANRAPPCSARGP